MRLTGPSPVYAYLRQPSMVDFPGRLAAVFFVSGCNFDCGFCHNAALMQPRRERLSYAKLAKVVAGFKADWVDGAVISGGEPTLAPGLPELIKFLKAQGLDVKLDTNGSRPEVLKAVIPLVDSVAMDVKCSLKHYSELAGYEDVSCISESVDLIMDSGRDYEFRTTVIESFHTDQMMHEIGILLKGAERYVLQAFVPRDDLPKTEFRGETRTTPDRLWALHELMQAYIPNTVVKGAKEVVTDN